jgi:formamidopyrimidine-DNA glycosylase
MPELPEVETTRRGIEPHVRDRAVQALVVRQPRLRWPVPAELAGVLPGQRVRAVERRAKYLLLRLDSGTLILHLGMSGSLRVLPVDQPAQKHDHLDLVLEGGLCLRLHDPRRFGALLWQPGPLEEHPLLRDLGPEPLSENFSGSLLHQLAGGRRVAVKNLIMDSRVVVGVGNIYASEALFLAGIHPGRSCARISARRYEHLAQTIKQVLAAAIEQGGTTLRDFSSADGRPGYFSLSLNVYGRAGEPCTGCGRPVRVRRIGQRSSFFCPHCQH